MTQAQQTAAVVVRLVALFFVLRGVSGLLGFAVFQRVVGGMGGAGMAAGSVLALLLLGGVLFFVAPALARVVTFDMD